MSIIFVIIFLLYLSSLPHTFLPEGVIVGFQNFACYEKRRELGLGTKKLIIGSMDIDKFWSE